MRDPDRRTDVAISLRAVLEYAVTPDQQVRIGVLLDTCFPDTFAGRTYFKQLPQQRILAQDGDALVGQVGLEHRVIRIGDACYPIFGVIDLCVAEGYRRQGLGRRLIGVLEELAKRSGIPFMVLMADDHRLYRTLGYRPLDVEVRWYVIEDRASYGVIERRLGDCFMVKAVGDIPWPPGSVDLLGYLF